MDYSLFHILIMNTAIYFIVGVAVSPVDYHARKPFLSFGKNPPPADFEQQVEQILAKLDQEKKTMRKIDKEGTE
ncbi:hypothetical protein [Proteus mirabilis]|uniref:hypothetical protein n=1 Tax=Proteus mirabilis TaxID=584 RepID=UPI0010728539|nr:hypothetical protein [Proteus mirabilis]TFU14335.1 hypothetical protein E4V27_13210 [Proteus mirabilis]